MDDLTQEATQRESRFFLTTERLGFRSWRPTDLEAALMLWGDPEVTRHIVRESMDAEQIRERLEAEIALEREYGVQYWPLFLLETGTHVGCCGLHPRDPGAGVYELGGQIRSALWRRGFAYEAAAAMIPYAFEHIGAHKLFAGHNPANEASRRLLEKLGFRYTHDEHYEPTGLEHPSYVLEAPEQEP